MHLGARLLHEPAHNASQRAHATIVPVKTQNINSRIMLHLASAMQLVAQLYAVWHKSDRIRGIVFVQLVAFVALPELLLRQSCPFARAVHSMHQALLFLRTLIKNVGNVDINKYIYK